MQTEHDEYQLMERHIRALNTNPMWRDAVKIFVPENNTGMGGHHLHAMVKPFRDVHTYWQKDRPGVLKTASSTDAMQKMMVSCLFRRRLVFEINMVTNSRGMTQTKILASLRDQMERFHWDHKPAKDAHSKDRWTMTGKMGSTKQDDLMITTMMAYNNGLDIINTPDDPVFANVAKETIRRFANIVAVT